jgi:hypothetical protein
MRSWKLLVPLASLAAVLATEAVVLWSPPARVTQENFERIRVGMSKTEIEAILGRPGDYRTASGETGVPGRAGTYWVSDSKLNFTDSALTWREDPDDPLKIEHESGTWLGDTFQVGIWLDDSEHVKIFTGVPRRTTQTGVGSLAWRLQRQWRRWFPVPQQAIPKRRVVDGSRNPSLLAT